jgi:hypothetical protein
MSSSRFQLFGHTRCAPEVMITTEDESRGMDRYSTEDLSFHDCGSHLSGEVGQSEANG